MAFLIVCASKIDCLGVVNFSLPATLDALSALMLFQKEKSGTVLVWRGQWRSTKEEGVRRDGPAVHKDARWKLLEQLAMDQCSTESGQHRSIDPRAIPRRVLFFFSLSFLLFLFFFFLRHGPSVAVVWLFHPSPLAVDVHKSRHESWKRWQSLAVPQPSKWRWRGRNRAEQATLQSRRLCTVDRFWILWPRFWHRLPCPPFHYRRVSGRPARQIVAKAANSSVHPVLIFCRPLPWWWPLLLHLMTVRSRLPSGWFLPKGSTRLEPQRRVIQLHNYV